MDENGTVWIVENNDGTPHAVFLSRDRAEAYIERNARDLTVDAWAIQ